MTQKRENEEGKRPTQVAENRTPKDLPNTGLQDGNRNLPIFGCPFHDNANRIYEGEHQEDLAGCSKNEPSTIRQLVVRQEEPGQERAETQRNPSQNQRKSKAIVAILQTLESFSRLLDDDFLGLTERVRRALVIRYEPSALTGFMLFQF